MEVTDPPSGEVKKAKQPFVLHLPGDRLLAFAGVVSSCTPPEGEAARLTCSILTRDAEGSGAEIHERMPVVLPQQAQATWLNPQLTDAGKVLGIAREVAVTQVAFYPVSKRVNSSKNEGAELLEPSPNPA